MSFLRLIRVEWVKTMRMRSTYIAFIAAGLLILFIQMGLYFGADESLFYQFLKSNGFPTTLLLNGFVSTRVGMEVGFALLLAPMTILTFARQIAGEDLRGTLRLMLVRPVSRPALLTAKFLVCAVNSILLMGFFLFLSFGVGLTLYGPQETITVGRFSELDPRNYAADKDGAETAFDRGRLREASEAERQEARLQRRSFRDARNFAISRFVIGPEESLRRLFAAWLLSSWALLAIGSLAFFFSAVNRHPIAAMALTIGTYFTLMILQGLASQENIIPIFRAAEPYLLTTLMDFWRGCFSLKIEWGSVLREGGLLGLYTAAFFGMAQWIFWRKDITS
jgi:ABC-type transport system involved in multi-copper enzyme maturation permease subunit